MEPNTVEPVLYPKEPVIHPKPRDLPPAKLRRRGPPIEAETDRLLAKVSAVNQAFILAGVTRKRGNGLRAVSTNLWARAVCRLDDVMQGAPFQAMGADELSWAMAEVRKRHKLAPRSMAAFGKHLKAAWRDLLNTDSLPRDINRALTVNVPPMEEQEARVLSDEDFHALLRSAATHVESRDGLPACVLYIAVLWTLWDSGFRADEMLSLNIGDVTLFPNGTAKLRLRPEAPEMGHGEHKTGPRIVNVGECVPALTALLAMHPRAGDRDAPLFPNPLRRSSEDRLRYLNLNRIVTRLADATGLNEVRGVTNNVTPHDFRHTCATRKARMGWNESQLRKHFGWGASSHMPAYYVHLRDMDLMERVRRDLGISPEGYPLNVGQPDPTQLVARALADLVASQQRPTGRTMPPQGHLQT